MENSRWAIYTKDKDLPLWVSSDRDSLQRLLDETVLVFGDKFYLQSYNK